MRVLLGIACVFASIGASGCLASEPAPSVCPEGATQAIVRQPLAPFTGRELDVAKRFAAAAQDTWLDDEDDLGLLGWDHGWRTANGSIAVMESNEQWTLPYVEEPVQTVVEYQTTQPHDPAWVEAVFGRLLGDGQVLVQSDSDRGAAEGRVRQVVGGLPIDLGRFGETGPDGWYLEFQAPVDAPSFAPLSDERLAAAALDAWRCFGVGGMPSRVTLEPLDLFSGALVQRVDFESYGPGAAACPAPSAVFLDPETGRILLLPERDCKGPSPHVGATGPVACQDAAAFPSTAPFVASFQGTPAEVAAKVAAAFGDRVDAASERSVKPGSIQWTTRDGTVEHLTSLATLHGPDGTATPIFFEDDTFEVRYRRGTGLTDSALRAGIARVAGPAEVKTEDPYEGETFRGSTQRGLQVWRDVTVDGPSFVADRAERTALWTSITFRPFRDLRGVGDGVGPAEAMAAAAAQERCRLDAAGQGESDGFRLTEVFGPRVSATNGTLQWIVAVRHALPEGESCTSTVLLDAKEGRYLGAKAHDGPC